MKRKAISISLSALLIGTLFTVVFMGSVSAMNDEQNLSGLVWEADGSAPIPTTGYCIWVERGANGTWYRFPDAPNLAQTEKDINGNSWYSFVLPDQFYNSRWADGDRYRVQVDGTPWSNVDGNCTSNATNPPPSGDPDPTFPGYVYDPTNDANSYNTINYAAGGGFANEQQWDVRTVAPLDIAPVNVTADGKRMEDLPFGIPVSPSTSIQIIFNVTNFGLITTGPFDIEVWECDSSYINTILIDTINHPGLNASEDSGIIVVNWVTPASPGDYYINISVDTGNVLVEFDETNNRYIIHFLIGPNLVPLNVQVNGLLPTDPINVGPGEVVSIINDVQNVGFSATGNATTIAFYEIPAIRVENSTPDLDAGETFSFFTWYWTVPSGAGDYYVYIEVDYYDGINEASEVDNIYTLHFFVGPDLVPNNVSVDGVLVVTYATINPLVPIQIGVNASNIGVSSTGIYTFNISYIVCDEFGVPLPSAVPFFNSSFVGPVFVGGFSQDVFGSWTPPLFQQGVLDYYILISVDYSNTVSETDEGNNYYILHLRMDAPDLTPYTVNVWVGGQLVQPFDTIPPYVSSIVEVPRGSDVTIEIIVTNIGGVDSGITNVTFYNISGVGGPPIDDPFDEPTPLPGVISGGTQTVSGIWANPGFDGMFYINISIDFNGTEINGRVLELNEYNNYFTLIINTTPIPITYFQPDQPRLFNTTGDAYYITNSTEIVLNSQGGTPPRYTWFKILWAGNSTEVLPWTNFTGMPFFTIPYGEYAYEIQYYTFDSVGALEITKSSLIIVDDSPPTTSIAVGDPKHSASGNDNWNITRLTPLTLSTTDNPPLMYGPPLLLNKASGINNPTKPQSGIFYRITGGFGTTDWFEGTSFNFNVINPAFVDGYYTIEYNSTDNLGNIEPTKSIIVYLDNTGPSTDITVGYPKYQDVPLPSYVKSGTPYTLSGDDGPGCGVNTTMFWFRIDNLDIPSGISWTNLDSFDIVTYFGQVDGNYALRYYCLDWLGNSGPQGIINLYVDETAPYITLVVEIPSFRDNPSDMWNISDTTNFRLTGATDGAGCGFNTTEYRISNATQPGVWQTYQAIAFNFAGFEDGEYTIDYRITDFLDNSRTMSENVVLDSTPPTTVIVIGDPKYPTVPILNITSVTPISFDPDDGLGIGVNVTEYAIYDDQGVVQSLIPYTGPFTLDTLADGEYDIHFHSKDWLDNVEAVNVYTLVVDNTGPTVDITGGQTDWNPDELAWNVDFDTFFRLTADDGPGSGVDIIEWRIRIDDTTWTTWQTYTAQFNLTLPDHGYWDHTIEFRARDNLGNYGEPDDLEIYIEGDITPPDPPVLRLYVQGNNILLDWDHSPDPDVHHYLIYRSVTKTGFDFSTHWIDTEADTDITNTPLRTQWNDTGAVSGSIEYYYTIRGVDGRSNIGSPSNIAGKVTMTFTKGYNTFALPLEPFDVMTASSMLSDSAFADTTDTIYLYDTASQQWSGKPKFMPAEMNDFDLEMGQGYMLNVKENTIQYTFTGAAATSIRYRGGVGDVEAFRDSFDVSASGNSVVLSWDVEPDATGYSIYRAETRMGTGSLTDFTLPLLVEVDDTTATYTDNTATGNEYYYMVVAQVDGADSSGTFAVGVRTVSYSQGYKLMSLELEPIIDDPSLSYYVNEIFTEDTSTLYYYDGTNAAWQGHPGFMPENMNNPDVGPGEAYLAYVSDQSVGYTYTGI
jgi:hypothetical protein